MVIERFSLLMVMCFLNYFHSFLNNVGMARGRGNAAAQGRQLVSRGRGANIAVRGRGAQRGNARGISRGRRPLTTRQLDNTAVVNLNANLYRFQAMAGW